MSFIRCSDALLWICSLAAFPVNWRGRSQGTEEPLLPCLPQPGDYLRLLPSPSASLHWRTGLWFTMYPLHAMAQKKVWVCSACATQYSTDADFQSLLLCQSASSACIFASASLQYFTIFSASSSHPAAGLGTQGHAPSIRAALALSTGKACGCLGRSPPAEGFPELGMEKEWERELLACSHQLCLVAGWWQGWPVQSLNQFPGRSGDRATALRFWSKASSHLPSFTEAGFCAYSLEIKLRNNSLDL